MRPLLLASLCLMALVACESSRPMTRTGEALDQSGSRTGEAVGRAASDTGAAVGRAGDWMRNRTQ